jgi:hypothetical protein
MVTRSFIGLPPAPTFNPAVAAGRYFVPISPGTNAVNGALGNTTVRLQPWYSPVPFAIDRIGGEISTAGEAGSKLRLLIYLDNGSAYPGDLLLDGGQINGDSATNQDSPTFTGPLTVPAGITWWGGAVQAAATTVPTVRTTNASIPPIPLLGGTTTPAGAGLNYYGYLQSGVSGAAPATFTSTVTSSGAPAPRLHCRISAWG